MNHDPPLSFQGLRLFVGAAPLQDAASLAELEAARVRREAEAEKLVGAGFPLLHLPALADPHAVLLRQTVR